MGSSRWPRSQRTASCTRLRAAVVEERLDRGTDRAAGEEDVVDEDDGAAGEVEVDVGGVDDRLRRRASSRRRRRGRRRCRCRRSAARPRSARRGGRAGGGRAPRRGCGCRRPRDRSGSGFFSAISWAIRRSVRLRSSCSSTTFSLTLGSFLASRDLVKGRPQPSSGPRTPTATNPDVAHHSVTKWPQAIGGGRGTSHELRLGDEGAGRRLSRGNGTRPCRPRPCPAVAVAERPGMRGVWMARGRVREGRRIRHRFHLVQDIGGVGLTGLRNPVFPRRHPGGIRSSCR